MCLDCVFENFCLVASPFSQETINKFNTDIHCIYSHCQIKASSHMCDTTRHDTTACDSTSCFTPIQSNGSVHTYAARPSRVITTKSCCNKNVAATV